MGTLNKNEIVLAKTQERLDKMLTSKAEALPAGFNKTRFEQNCMTVLLDVKDIGKYQPNSIVRTLLKGAFLGLDFFRKECYAIPYGNSIDFQTDYKGEVKLVKKYSPRPIKDVYAKVVREGDEYEEFIIDGKQGVNFSPKPFNDAAVKGAFAVVLYEDGGMLMDSMSTAEIEAVRDRYSKQKNGMMWTKSPNEAYKKTVIRRLTKSITLDFESKEQQEAYNDSSDMDFKDIASDEIVDPFVEKVEAEVMEDIPEQDFNTNEMVEIDEETES